MADLDVVKAKVQRILVEDLELKVMLGSDLLEVRLDSALVRVNTYKSGDGDDDAVLIDTFSPMLFGVPETPEVLKWIATEGASYKFGHARWIADPETPGSGTIIFTHVLLGDFLDSDELKTAFVLLATTAEELDDQLMATFGGSRATDA